MIEQTTVESYLGYYIDSGLALDVSSTNTGVTIFSDGTISNLSFTLEVPDGTQVPRGYQIKEFLDALDMIIGKRHFNIIAVEAPLSLINAKTNFSLIALNSLIDYKIACGDITCDEFLRVDNSSWKKVLRGLSGVEPYKRGEKDYQKKEVIECLQRLKFPLAYSVGSYKSWNAYLKSGVQDMLDSVGVLMGAVDAVYASKTTINATVSVKYKVFGTLESAMDFIGDRGVSEVTSGARGLMAFYKGLRKTSTEDKVWIYRGKDLGTFGVQERIYELYDEYFVVFVVNVKRKRVTV